MNTQVLSDIVILQKVETNKDCKVDGPGNIIYCDHELNISDHEPAISLTIPLYNTNQASSESWVCHLWEWKIHKMYTVRVR